MSSGYLTTEDPVRDFIRDLNMSRESSAKTSDGPASLEVQSNLVRHVQREEEMAELQAKLSRQVSPRDQMLFKKATHSLEKAIEDFRNLVPGQTSAVSTWEDVEEVISQVQEQWTKDADKSRFARVKERLRKLGKGINDHRTALKMIPSEGEYLSLITGSVSMVIKASANHLTITEAFSRGIVEINDAVHVAQQGYAYNTVDIQHLTMRLYSEIFGYLSGFIRWFTNCSRDRLKMSFNEDIQQDFQSRLDVVKDTSLTISRHVQLYMSVDVRLSRLQGEDLSNDTKRLLRMFEDLQLQQETEAYTRAKAQEAMEKSLAEIPEVFLERLFGSFQQYLTQQATGAAAFSLLEQQMSASRTMRRDASRTESGDSQDSSGSSSVEEAPLVAATIPAPSKPKASLRLEDYFDWERVHPFANDAGPVLADANFVTKLNVFATTPTSTMLYASNNPAYPVRNPTGLQQAVSAYLSLARQAGVPVLSYFCRLQEDAPPPSRTRQAIALIALLYALIQQLRDLSREPGKKNPVTDQDLACLDGTMRTWRQAMDLFSSLLESTNVPLMFIAIDGLEILEDEEWRSTTGEAEELVRYLSDLVYKRAKKGQMIKVIFTTAGLVQSLCDHLDPRDVVFCQCSRSPTVKRGRTRIAF